MAELPFGDNPFVVASSTVGKQATPLTVEVPQSSQLNPPPVDKGKTHRKRGHGMSTHGGNKDVTSKKGKLQRRGSTELEC